MSVMLLNVGDGILYGEVRHVLGMCSACIPSFCMPLPTLILVVALLQSLSPLLRMLCSIRPIYHTHAIYTVYNIHAAATELAAYTHTTRYVFPIGL